MSVDAFYESNKIDNFHRAVVLCDAHAVGVLFRSTSAVRGCFFAELPSMALVAVAPLATLHPNGLCPLLELGNEGNLFRIQSF